MTASLTSDRQKTLTERCGMEVFPRDRTMFLDLQRQMCAPRYIVKRIDAGEAADVVRGELEKKKRVLWVLNTVERCQTIVTNLAGFCTARSIPCTCYHSRFRLMDRKKRHEEAINLFRKQQGAALSVTTQVCEMSLDLDADILVTEMAPVPSLIQRMGRCCRVADPKDRRGEIFVCLPPDEKPYTEDEINQCTDFVKWLVSRGEVSQDDLSRYLTDELEVPKPHVEGGFTGFIDSGWYAMGAEESFREGIDFTVECILDSDIENYNNLYKKREAIDGLVVPVPKRWASREQIIGHRFPVAPSRHYSPLTGFSEQEVADA
jgi:CRISPR-associated endonuclease/helicase Cas3